MLRPLLDGGFTALDPPELGDLLRRLAVRYAAAGRPAYG
jgi:hypothetical protein